MRGPGHTLPTGTRYFLGLCLGPWAQSSGAGREVGAELQLHTRHSLLCWPVGVPADPAQGCILPELGSLCSPLGAGGGAPQLCVFTFPGLCGSTQVPEDSLGSTLPCTPCRPREPTQDTPVLGKLVPVGRDSGP